MAKTKLIKYYKTVRESASQSDIASMNDVLQHGNTTILLHALAVSYYSCLLAKKLGLDLDYDALCRGALLHDYFGYDWHSDECRPRHALRHGLYALHNARREFAISDKEADIISHHMFPLAGVPRCREAWIVSLVDKGCAVREMVSRHGYRHLRPLAHEVAQG